MTAPSLPALLVSQWSLTAAVAVPATASVVLYALGVRRSRRRWPVRRTVSFVAGVGCVVLALQSGIDAYDDRMLSVHMVQHMLLLLVAPPLVLGGRPLVLALRSLPPRHRRSLARAVGSGRTYTGPVPALGLFGAAVVLTHLPSFYDATLRHSALHYAEHALYLTAGLLMWSPLLDGDPAPRHRLNGLGKLVYLIAAMMPMALVGAYLNRDATLVYAAYGPPARALGISALSDQARAGAIMWVVGNSIMVAVGLWAAVAAMVSEERRQVARESQT
ncbi:MAG TPA: cytochrome c oxidase assembly protein [Solirubrobacteraceae bacterium]|nr:cytochrome c oxidase assembly protein [Solirubrobacteraceae bacterium]